MRNTYRYIVSACLCGQACRYDGGVSPVPSLVRLAGQGAVLALCPELLGGLAVPRQPCEICEERVLDKEGRDCTQAFRRGAERVLALAREHGIGVAILKERSPSCGVHQIYDGSFSGRLLPGSGVTARLLAGNGVEVLSEADWLERLARDDGLRE